MARAEFRKSTGSRGLTGTADTATPTRHFDDCKGKFPDNFEQTQPLSPLSTAHTANVLRLRNSGLLMIPDRRRLKFKEPWNRACHMVQFAAPSLNA